MGGDSGPRQAGGGAKARDLNELIRYVMWSVFRVTGPDAIGAAGPAGAGAAGAPVAARAAVGGGRVSGRPGLAAGVTELCRQGARKGGVTRGCFDLPCMRAGAD